MMAPSAKMHLIMYFVGYQAYTRCGKYVANISVTAFRDQVTCKVCQRVRHERA